MELAERTEALMNWLFGFDLKRAKEIAIEMADEMNGMWPGSDWDHMDGTTFTDHAKQAYGIVRMKNPWLFL